VLGSLCTGDDARLALVKVRAPEAAYLGLQRLRRMQPPRKDACARHVEVLGFLVRLSAHADGRQAIASVPDLGPTLLARWCASSRNSLRERAALLLRNMCFLSGPGPHLDRDAAVERAVELLEVDDTCVRTSLYATSVLWVLLYHHQSVKAGLRGSGHLARILDFARRFREAYAPYLADAEAHHLAHAARAGPGHSVASDLRRLRAAYAAERSLAHRGRRAAATATAALGKSAVGLGGGADPLDDDQIEAVRLTAANIAAVLYLLDVQGQQTPERPGGKRKTSTKKSH
jgi:hypothetical protein